jgi:uncharacterized membrane protein (DUF2068 family)
VARVDWDLRACARQGHETYAPTERRYAEQLTAPTAAGTAWRCLRCGAFVPGPPRRSGPAAAAPVLLRVRSSQASLRQLLANDLPAAQGLADRLQYDLTDSALVRGLRGALDAPGSTLLLLAAGLAAYAAVELVEAVGLWLLKRWAEYFTVVATAAFVPLEVYDLVEKVTWLRVGALLVNLAAVAYIVLSKRLFGVRGGHAAYARERASVALLEVQEAAGEDGAGPVAVAAPAASAP